MAKVRCVVAALLLSDETDPTSEDLSAATTPSSADSETTTDSLTTTGETSETETVTPSKWMDDQTDNRS